MPKVIRAADAKTIAYESLAIFVGPALLLVFPELPFTNSLNCDPWYVYGTYFNLPEYLRWYPDSRQVGRLSATLPGYFLKQTLPGIASDYGLFVLFFTLAAFFLYKTAALLFSPERAAFATLFFALSPIVIGNYSVTFSGPVITYEILALYCAVRAVSSAKPGHVFSWMLLSGIAWGASLHAHLAVLAFSGFIYMFFTLCILLEFERSIQSRIRTIVTGVCAVLSGLITITAALSIFAAIEWGARYSTVLNQVYVVFTVLERDANIFWHKEWYQESGSTGMYLLGIGAAAISIVTYGMPLRRCDVSAFERRGFAVGASFMVTFAVLFYDTLSRGIFLQYAYYYAFLWPFLALTLFALKIDQGLNRRGIFVIFFAVACFAGVMIRQYEMPEWLDSQQAALSIFLAITAIILLLFLQRTAHAFLLGGYLLVLASTMLVVRTHQMGGQIWEEPNRNEPRDSFIRLNSGLRFLSQTLRNRNVAFRYPRFWVDQENVDDALAYPRSYLYCQLKPLPNMDPKLWYDVYANLEPGDVLVVIARPEALFDRVKTALNGLNLQATKIDSKKIVDEEGLYEILVVLVSSGQF
jgi:hypothetical protein